MVLEEFEKKQRGDLSKNKGRGYLNLNSPLSKELKEQVVQEIVDILQVQKTDITIHDDAIYIEPLVRRIKKKQFEELKEKLSKLSDDIGEIQQ